MASPPFPHCVRVLGGLFFSSTQTLCRVFLPTGVPMCQLGLSQGVPVGLLEDNCFAVYTVNLDLVSSLGRYVFGSEISYNKAPPRLPGLAC
jgi:hypothetical protein